MAFFRLNQDMEVEEELSKEAWKSWKVEKMKKDKAKEKGKDKQTSKAKKTGIFTKMRRVQVIAGKIADKIEPIRAYLVHPRHPLLF